eukprot:Phypoly_transcript_00178.p1 GENE.Phypoly_transcript_00178~~Phypoly_transcript_00178.p1  ORF type:complete len:1068 (-),score=137.60 Phypoly_transcript_00178:3031-5769(-)
MAVSFPMDANIISTSTWWLGEKYDGIRCCWNPKKDVVYSRFGNELLVAPEILSVLPRTIVEGELWFGRGLFSHIFMLVNKSSVAWDQLRMPTFDCPTIPLQNKPFEARYKELLKNTSGSNPFVVVATRLLCSKQTRINHVVEQIINDGGEGAILRKVGSFYDPGRSQSLLKLKTSIGDREGVVIGISQKAVKLKLPNGVTFHVPNENVQVSNVSVGDIVTFSYENQAKKDIPTNPKIYRIRNDVSWKDVVHLFYKDKKHLNEYSAPIVKQERKQSIGYWTIKKMKLFLENFALNRNMDPSVPDTWYKIHEEDLYQEKKGRNILKKFDGYANAIRYLFPDIVNASFAPKFSKEYRRRFFEKYASANGFDPLLASNWYLQPKEKIMATKNSWQVVFHHGGSISNALRNLFPEIVLDKSKMFSLSWPKNRRALLELYAHRNGFDPLTPDNWYTQSRKKIAATVGCREVLFYYKNSLTKTLIALFPEIEFDQRKLSASKYLEESTRRKFFENYAAEYGFDPLIPENWYKTPRSKINALKGIKHILFYHKTIAQALLDLFPEIGLDKRTLWAAAWYLPSNRRKFFESYATKQQFDQLLPSNWYSQSKELMLAEQKINKVLFYHNDDLATALLELFPEIGLEHEKLWPSSWNSRRNYFIEYAKRKNFDPFDPKNWYSQSVDHIMEDKEAKEIVKYHGGNVARALCDLFPEIGLQKAKLWSTSSSELPKIRTFFENYAKKHGFDPLKSENWYKQTKGQILSSKGASQVTLMYGARIQQALVDAFPDIGMDIDKLWTSSWHEPKNRRQFFEDYAKKNGFDPLHPENWYLQSQDDILAEPKSSRVLFYHNSSISKALSDLFPDIGIDATKKWTSMLHSAKNRRIFFENYAKENAFDYLVPESWYSHLPKLGAAKVSPFFFH